MQIIYHGLGCFRLQDGNVSVLVDPYEERSGLKIPKQQNDIVVYSDLAVTWRPVNKETFLITEPGEYEVKKVFVYALSAGPNHLVHIIEIEGITLAHLGGVVQADLSPAILDRCKEVDILMIPVGNGSTLSAKQAQTIITELEPRIVMPMYYDLPGLKVKLEGVESFKKEVGGSVETVEKFKVSRKDLPAEDTKVIIIEPTV
jgi:L-ascorbate metabolism protein UlaG (beta-lactamase superfamily)